MGILKQTKLIYQFSKGLKGLKQSKDSVQHHKAQAYLDQLLKEQGGLFKKIVQYMGTQDESLEALAYEQEVGVSLEEISALIKKAYPDLKLEVQDIAYSASIGQVQRAKLEGKDIVVKVRYPGIKEVLSDQLVLLNLLPKTQGIGPAKKWGFDFKPYQQTIQNLLDFECNFEHEAKELIKWEVLLKPLKYANVPFVYENTIKEDCYIQEFIEGSTVIEVAKYWSLKERKEMGEKLVFSFLYLFMNHGVMQGDSNFGNYLFRKREQDVVYLDLGQSLKFSKEFYQSFNHLMSCLLQEQDFSALGFFCAIGFDEKKIKAIAPKLPLLIQILFEPFVSNKVSNLKRWNYKEDIETLLGDDKWWFRSSGSQEFFLFMKGFMGLKNILNKWDIGLNWNQILKEVLAQYNPPTLSIQPISFEGDKSYIASKLSVRVTDCGEERVRLSLPFMAVFDLKDYIDAEVLELIEQQGLSVEKVVKNALSDGGKPKVLFELVKGQKDYLVALE